MNTWLENCIQDHCKIRSFNGYSCSSCMKVYKSEDNIDTIFDHLQQDHNDMLQLKCEGHNAACSMDSYQDIKDVIAHMLNFHTLPEVPIETQILKWLQIKEENDLMSFNTSKIEKASGRSKINTLLNEYRNKQISTPKNDISSVEDKQAKNA